MPRERTQGVCEGLAAAMRRHGVPQQILTDNGKVFTGRCGHPPTVDWPAPVGPRNPVTVPGTIVTLRECTAVVPP